MSRHEAEQYPLPLKEEEQMPATATTEASK